MTALSPADYRRVLRGDFHAFLMRCFAELHGGRSYSPAWHVEVMAAKLAAVRQGKARRLIVNIPPRHLKSLAASVALPAWLLGHDPTLAIINVTYGQNLSDKFARDCRAMMTSAWYQSLFATRLASPRPPFQELITTSGGFRLATSVGGVLTGRGADVILIDDPLKPADAMSESRRAAANEWFDSTLYSRLNDKQNGSIVIVMQRLHEDDLAGHALEKEGFDVVSFPAIAEEDELHRIETLLGPAEFGRSSGEALNPKREPIETLSRIRSTIGEYNFAAQYQQRPAPRGGGMIKEAWFRRFSAGNRPQTFDRIVQSWDTANKPSELSDYSVCTTWGLKGPNFYLLDVLRKKLSYPELKRAVVEQDSLFHPEAILDRRQGFGNAAHPGADRGGLFARHALCPGGRQDHAPARPDGDDRERLRLPAGRGRLARRFFGRAHHVSGRPLGRPGRFDRPIPRMDEAPNRGGGVDRVLADAGGGGGGPASVRGKGEGIRD